MISALRTLLGGRGNSSPAPADQPDPAAPLDPAIGTVVRDGEKTRAEEDAERALKQFFAVAPERVAEIRSLFAQVSAAAGGDARTAILANLCSRARVLRLICDSPALESVCKIATALERLLKQISEQPSRLTPSTLRTIASSVVLLETLCKPGVKLDLVSNPPPRCLSIDDDAFCRRAISSSLEQAFSAPDHAESGDEALALVQKHSYDIIFLDVEMPGMNGYEVCTKIHQTELNPKTPVVFVTIYSDFDSRVKASESSGQDLIAKPFLSAELTLKALTLLVRRRMQSSPPAGV